MNTPEASVASHTKMVYCMLIRLSPSGEIMSHDPNDPRHNRVRHVPVGDGAVMSLPYRYWFWRLNWTKDTTPPNICDDRRLVVGVLESYFYLVTECSKEEAWRRIKLLRSAILADPEPSNW